MKELFEVTIEVLQKCPNQCIYCSSWSSIDRADALDFGTICGIVEDAAELGAKLINISGGEPLMRTDIVDIIDYIKSKGLKIRLYSSGIYYNKGYQSIPNPLLEAITGKVDTVIFNYETARPELYAKIMGTVPGNLLLLEETIQRAINHGITVEAHLVPMKCNYQEIPQTLERLYSLGISKVSILRFVPQGRSIENVEATVLSIEDDNALRIMLQGLSKQYKDKLRLGKPYRSGKFYSCRTGTIRLAVRYDGYVFPCGAFKDGMMAFRGYPPESIRDMRLAEIYKNSMYIKAVRAELEKYYEGKVVEPCFGQHCRYLCM